MAWYLHQPGRVTRGDTERKKALDRVRFHQPDADFPVPPPKAAVFDPPADSRIRRIDRDPRHHAGRRDDRRSDVKVTRGEREHAALHLLGVFRVASRKALVDAVCDGHPFVATRLLGGLVTRGFVKKKKVAHGKRGYDV